MTKILVTCPPMLGQIDLFKERLEALGCDVTAAEVVQVLTGTS